MRDAGVNTSSDRLSSLYGRALVLFKVMSTRRRLQFFVTLGLMLIGAVAELITIGAVLPFLAIAADTGYAEKLPLLNSILTHLSGAFGGSMIVSAAVLLIGAALFSSAARLALTWATQKFVFGIEYDITMNVFGRVVRQRYDYFVRQNSSVVLSGMEKIYRVTEGIILPVMVAFTSIGIALCILGFLFMVDPATATLAAVSMGLLYLVLSLATQKLMMVIASVLAEVHSARLKLVQESLGGLREIILDHSQDVFERKLAGLERQWRRYRTIAYFLHYAPRFVVEASGIILIALLAIHFSGEPGGMVAAIPILGALALGAQRLLPLLQQIYLGWSSYSVNSEHLREVMQLLRLPVRTERRGGQSAIEPFGKIELRDLSFSYGERAPALNHVDLTIVRGERLGLIGKTGSGKSTLVDVLMGLLQPTGGAMLIDGVKVDEPTVADWQAQIAHVPQAIFLADDTIAANIAFGCEGEPDLDRVWRAAERAHLRTFIEQLPEGLATKVGERGVRLSGGQRQRIGIARALYKNATLLVLDEATSALDDDTEKAIMEAVSGLERDLTIILIAHRLTTLAVCDRIYRLDGGRIVESGSYEHVVLAGKV